MVLEKREVLYRPTCFLTVAIALSEPRTSKTIASKRLEPASEVVKWGQ